MADSTFLSQWKKTWRDYQTDGQPLSGDNDPDKAEIRAVGSTMDALFAAAITGERPLVSFTPAGSSGSTGYPTTGGSGPGGAIREGDQFIADSAGFIRDQAIEGGDLVIAKVNAPGQTAANWTYINRAFGFTPQNVANRVASWSTPPLDTNYPSEKLVYDTVQEVRSQRSPLQFLEREGTFNTERPQVFPGLISASVDGAVGDEVFQVSYIAWGFYAPNPQGVIIRRWASQDVFKEDEDNDQFQTIHNFTDATTWSFGEDYIKTVRIVPKLRPDVTIILTIDGSKLPTFGSTPFNSTASNLPGVSYILDPACYRAAISTGGGSGLYWLNDEGSMTVAWPHGVDKLMRLTVNKTGTLNGLPNIINVGVADANVPNNAAFSTINSGGGDWWPPLVFRIPSGGDGSTLAYTGGNHLSGGGSTGDPTAELESYQVWVDNTPAQDLETQGFGHEVVISWSNLIQAYNTRSTSPPRYVARQRFSIRITQGSIETTCTVEAMENMVMLRDNGPQMPTAGFRTALHFWGGEGFGKLEPWIGTDHESGAISTYPTSRIAVVTGDSGHMVSWLDADFGICAEADSTTSARPAMYSDGGTNKVYHSAVYNTSVGISMSAGERYSWRGGYAFSPEEMTTGDLEAAFRRTLSGRTQYCSVLPSSGSGRILTQATDIGREVDPSGYIDIDGLPVSGGAYTVSIYTVDR